MTVWEYRFDGPEPSKSVVTSPHCIFCETVLRTLNRTQTPLQPRVGWRHITEETKACPVCGWWVIHAVDQSYAGEIWIEDLGAYGHLRNLNLADLSQPIEEVKRYLLAKYEERFVLHPRLFEETVASVFRDLGYTSEVTGYQNDGGIDAILGGPDGELIGVQVKRYKNSINVEQIRALIGALLVGGFAKGMFVTTSSFQSGAGKIATRSTARGIPIDLVDAKRFFEALKIGTRELYANYEEWKEMIGELQLRSIEISTA